jgi:hypothetical protein
MAIKWRVMANHPDAYDAEDRRFVIGVFSEQSQAQAYTHMNPACGIDGCFITVESFENSGDVSYGLPPALTTERVG